MAVATLAGVMALGINVGILGAAGSPEGPGRLGPGVAMAPSTVAHVDRAVRPVGHGERRSSPPTPREPGGAAEPSPSPPRHASRPTTEPSRTSSTGVSSPIAATPGDRRPPADAEHRFGANDDD
jgi:hypothetical protein